MIEPSGIGAVLQGVGALAQAFAIFGAAWLASNTFASWRKQKLSERRIDLAERILTATYKVRRGLSHIRNPAMWSYELSSAEEKLKTNGEWPKSSDAQDRLRTQQAYYNRITATRPDRIELEDCQPLARALFGDQLERAIETLNRQANVVQVYVDANARDRSNADRDFRSKIDEAIFEGHPYDGTNKMDQTIADQVRLIEDTLLPILRLAAK